MVRFNRSRNTPDFIIIFAVRDRINYPYYRQILSIFIIDHHCQLLVLNNWFEKIQFSFPSFYAISLLFNLSLNYVNSLIKSIRGQ